MDSIVSYMTSEKGALLGAGISIISLIYAFYLTGWIKKQSPGTERMQELAGFVQQGAMAFLKTEYKILSVFALIVAGALYFGVDSGTAISYLAGALASGLAGWIGMRTATVSAVRTTEAAKTSLTGALRGAFRSGAVMGLTVVGLGLLGVSILFTYWYGNTPTGENFIKPLFGFSFGASSIALFARVGGGIFTKAADVGADLVGKVEAGIPEDDPRNPAVIADNVGDNVGDCAGMAADLFETYVVTVGATMVLTALLFGERLGDLLMPMMALPLLIGGACIVTSIIGTYFVKLGKGSTNVMGAMYKGFLISAVLAIPLIWLVMNFALGGMGTELGGSTVGVDPGAPLAEEGTAEQVISFTGMDLFICAVIGLAITGLIIWITEYYTGTNYRPVRSIAKSSETGHGTNVIQGLAISLESTALPTIVIVAGIIATFQLAGLMGIAYAATAMLALAGMVVALDAYGPVTDNAGGIAEMAGLDDSVREKTDLLDAVGNTTKAVTKGYAIGSAGLGALVLFAAYTTDLAEFFPDADVDFSLENPYVIVGLLLGALLPYLFGAMGMTAVGRAAGDVVKDVREQFAGDAGIMAGTSKPNYARTVDLVTKAAIKEMIVPSMLPVLAPIAVYFAIFFLAGQENAFAAVGALLLGVIIGGIFVALSMTAGGGAWDNAKKYIEDGNHGGKGSEAHKAAVTGDTVGDPYKDTAGPAVNPMIKITNIVALLLLAALAAG